MKYFNASDQVKYKIEDMEFKEFFTPAVIWFLIGLFFLLLELAIPGLIVFFFGLGAWITSLFILLFEPGFNAQLLIFVVTSILGVLLLRKFLKHKFFGSTDENVETLEDEFIGRIAITDAALSKNIPGKISFKGTQWTVIADNDYDVGERVKIEKKDSLTLFVTKA